LLCAALDRPGRPGPVGGGGSSGDAQVVEGALDPRNVAVLYFEDLSDGTLGHVADGLTEGLIDELARVRALSVVSRGGVAPYRNAEVPRDSIARILMAGSLVQGSLEPVGSRVRVTARLVDGTSGVDVQRASFELPADQLLAVQDSLVQEVARLLRTRLGEEVRLQERRGRTASVDAWALFHRAERLRKEGETLLREDDLPSAAAAFARADSTLAMAESADPEWLGPVVARAWVAYRRSRLERGLEGVPWLEVGLDHASRALARTPNHPEALAARGTLRYRLWELRADPDPTALNTLLRSAQRDLEAAVAADPTLARANIILSSLYYQVDDVPGALLAARRAYEEDAYLEEARVTLIRLFWGSLDLEQLSEARRWCTEGARRFPDDYRFVQCQLWLMATPALTAEPDRAWQLLGDLQTLTPAPRRDYVLLEAHLLTAGALARAAHADSALSVLASTRERVTHEIDPHQDLLSVEAYIRTLTGDHDGAIDLLKRYVAANPGHPFAETAGTVWWWRGLRNHPRFHEVSQPGR
jgi:TolB-like protein